MQLVRKISRATVIGGKDVVLELVMSDKAKPHVLYRIGGMCTGVKSGESVMRGEGEDQKRPWSAMLGKFKAINAITGEVFYSGVCFLPQYVIDAVTAQLAGDVESVKFLFDVAAQYDKDSATSYVYLTNNLIEPTEDDALEQLVGSQLTAIAGPKADAPAPADAQADKARGKGK